jgi:hypothetical protein
MAQRITDRFENLLAIKVLDVGDRKFAESLFDFYKKNKRLTTGRRQWLTKLEQKYTPESIAQRAAEVAARSEDPLNKRLQALLDNEGLNASTREFITSLHQQFNSRGYLTPGQQSALEKVEARHTPEALANKATWVASYDDEKRTRARIVAEYYLPTGYFHDLAETILSDETFIPTEKQFNSITGNKYAQKVLTATLDEPKFSVGSTVMLRSKAPIGYQNRTALTVPALVIANEGTVKSAARGAKPYTILPFGHTEPIQTEERHLKKFRGKK